MWHNEGEWRCGYTCNYFYSNPDIAGPTGGEWSMGDGTGPAPTFRIKKASNRGAASKWDEIFKMADQVGVDLSLSPQEPLIHNLMVFSNQAHHDTPMGCWDLKFSHNVWSLSCVTIHES